MILNQQVYRNRPTRAEINITNLINNLQIVKSQIGPDVKIMACVKANGYGHGILRISQELIKAGAHYLGVAYLEEAMFLRKNGITAPILVMGAINSEQIADFIQHDIDITSSSIDKSRTISKVAQQLGKTAKVHLKFDTGMERIGVHWYNAEPFIKQTVALPGIQIKGIFSHLAKSESDVDFTGQQIQRFNEIIELYKTIADLPELIHLANSGGIIHHPDSYFNMVRPGIMLYGYNPCGYLPDVDFSSRKLQPVMNLKTKVSYFKVCPANTGISYNHSYVTTEQTRIITLPLGYGDGYSRLLSNKGKVIVRGKEHPVVGTVCMDQVMVDVGPDGEAYNGDDVLLFGEMDGAIIPLESVCEKTGTITYEFLCGISSRVPRIYIL